MRARRIAGLVGILFGAVVTLGVTNQVLDSRGQAQRLREQGKPVQASVVRVVDESRTGVPLTVDVELPDHRLTQIDLDDSDQFGAKVGDAVRVVVDPNGRGMPQDVVERSSSALADILAFAWLPVSVAVIGVWLLLWDFRRAKSGRSGQARG